MFEPNYAFSKSYHLKLNNRLLKRQEGLWVTNFTNYPITIFEGAKLGQVRRTRHKITQSPSLFAVEQAEFNVNELVINKELTREQNLRIIEILEEYKDSFAWSLGQLGESNVGEITLDTKDSTPVHHTPYRTSHKEKEIICEQVQEMLKNGIIRESYSAFASPVVLVKKHSGNGD